MFVYVSAQYLIAEDAYFFNGNPYGKSDYPV